jgi:hypothetical protein
MSGYNVRKQHCIGDFLTIKMLRCTILKHEALKACWKHGYDGVYREGGNGDDAGRTTIRDATESIYVSPTIFCLCFNVSKDRAASIIMATDWR